MDNSSGPDDEISIDPFPVPNIPIPRAVRAIASRISRAWPPGNWRPQTWRSWLLAAIAAVVIIGALRLAGVIWTSAPPRWVSALGPGVTVTGPRQVAPGYDSPGAALVAVLTALNSKNPAAYCAYAYAHASSVAKCETDIRGTAPNKMPRIVSVKIGYVAVDGTRALAVITGKICLPGNKPECVTNADPAAIFSTGNTFAALWAQTVQPTSSSRGYSLLPCAEVGGKWYADSAPTEPYS